jgi:hypothetical protein
LDTFQGFGFERTADLLLGGAKDIPTEHGDS